MQTGQKTISVIIPSIGRETMQQCLDAMERQTRRPDEIIIARDPHRMGIGFARNDGIAQAKGNLLAFTDDDCVPPDNWLENLLAVMDQFDADVVGGTMCESDPFLNAIRMRHPFPSIVQEDIHGIVGNGANIIYKRSVLDECLRNYGYIHQLGAGEDIELIWRLQQLGVKIVYTPNAVLHLRKMTPGAYLKRQFIRGIAVANLYRAYRTTKVRFTAQPSLLWGHGKTGHGADWWKALWFKVIGPFDVESFHSSKDFLVFWLGEKIQGLGFLWGMFGNHYTHRMNT